MNGTDAGRIIAIGDVHGCSRALTTLIDGIQPTELDTLVFLGDLIDRGPDSRGVIDRVMALRDHCTVVALMGNHEEMLLGALQNRSELEFWLKFGGVEALASYGHAVGVGIQPSDLPSIIPAEHLSFIMRLENYAETIRHFFVHAYYDPLLPLHQQHWDELRWASFMPNPQPHCSGKIAIVGHVEQRTGAILDCGCLKCIDTFCYGTGWLTALDVATDKTWQARNDGSLRVASGFDSEAN